MVITKLFLNNKTQAVRLPKEVAFPAGVDEVEIIESGNARFIVPVGERFLWWFDHGARFSEDFMVERDQPPMQERDWSAFDR